MPDFNEEPDLFAIAASIDRLVESAYESVRSDAINFFGQRKIASFLPKRAGYAAPLVYKLQEGTYRAYKLLWKRLLAFIYRTNRLDRPSQLRHRLNT